MLCSDWLLAAVSVFLIHIWELIMKGEYGGAILTKNRFFYIFLIYIYRYILFFLVPSLPLLFLFSKKKCCFCLKWFFKHETKTRSK